MRVLSYSSEGGALSMHRSIVGQLRSISPSFLRIVFRNGGVVGSNMKHTREAANERSI
jgi:NADPH-dependent ferric siderophore reductase